MSTPQSRSIITDKLVLAKTGHGLVEWYQYLDEQGAKSMSHREIFELVSATDGLRPLGEWNQNLLTTSYEWDRGLKQRGERPDGFEISVSKTINRSAAAVYESIVIDGLRTKWLAEPIEITKLTRDKSLRAVWMPGPGRLSIDIYPKGETKSQMVLQHLKIDDADTAGRLRAFWIERLTSLKIFLET